MKVWKFESKLDAGFESIHTVNFDEFHGKYFDIFNQPIPIADGWENLEVYTLTEGYKSDFPHFWGESFVPVFSEKALNVVHDLIENQVEILPLSHPEHKYFVIHVLNVIDAIDFDKSLPKRILKSGRKSGFKKYSFVPEKIIGQQMFKVYYDDGRVHSQFFVSDGFKDRVTSSSLVGYEFIEVWDSEKADS
ncbi:imm11 family protein [Desmospora profundinema]|uniref:Immunity MXAN-0049 protein domain-containing protein n=1 Tax=Desmospora profundinema TaxID=1571184 RepID=A0ABU1IGV1_9BACL|nr:DUF1629 domain-containing protein [Desmospora profundinema]MDR6224015.1 hypothetical protein [Desmospora profundinema]